jgi:hypothetical protein
MSAKKRGARERERKSAIFKAQKRARKCSVYEHESAGAKTKKARAQPLGHKVFACLELAVAGDSMV